MPFPLLVACRAGRVQHDGSAWCVGPFFNSATSPSYSPTLQCHTNLVAVFSELEEEPELGKDLFSSTASLSSLLTTGGDGAPGGSGGGATTAGAPAVGTAEGGIGAEPGSGDPAGQGRAQGNGEGNVRVVLLSRPQRRFVAPAQRTPKLRGMVRVVCASSECGSAWHLLGTCMAGLVLTIRHSVGWVLDGGLGARRGRHVWRFVVTTS